MTQPLVSIIIPSYNDSRYLEDSINSALQQTYKNIEIIVVDDGSTNTVDKEFFKNFPFKKVRLVQKQNEGLAMARNTGITESKGEFYVPLDADDKISPDFVEKCLEKMATDTGVVYTDQKFFGEENKVIPMKDYDMVFELVKNHISVCSLVRRETYEDVKKQNGVGYNPNMKFGYEDWDFWISVGETRWNITRLPKPLFYYRKRKGSMMSNTLTKHSYLVNELLNNHPDTYSKNHVAVIKILQDLYLDTELRLAALSNETQKPTWLLKRLALTLKPKSND